MTKTLKSILNNNVVFSIAYIFYNSLLFFHVIKHKNQPYEVLFTYGLCFGALSSSDCSSTVFELLVNYKLERIRKEEIITLFEVLFRDVPGDTVPGLGQRTGPTGRGMNSGPQENETVLLLRPPYIEIKKLLYFRRLITSLTTACHSNQVNSLHPSNRFLSQISTILSHIRQQLY